MTVPAVMKRLFPLFLSAFVCATAQEHKHPHDDAPGTLSLFFGRVLGP